MSNDKMRGEFEAWATEGWPGERLAKFANGDYCGHTLNFCWLAWQASRAAVVVELPEGMTIAEHMYGVVSPPGHERWFPRQSAVKAIEAAGLKVNP